MEKRVFVLVEFADKDDYTKVYKVGTELTGFDENRIANLVKRGLAGYEQDEIPTEIDLTENYQRILAKVKIFENVEKLEQYLSEEQAAEKPRASVVKAIEERLENLSNNE